MPDLAQYTILIIDDDPDSRDFLSMALGDAGATVHEAADGVEGLELLRKLKPDLVTLDLEMPRKTGPEVFAEMRGDTELQSIPVLIITGRPELRHLIYQRTVPPPEGYLDKPIDEADLLRNVRKILRASRH